MMVSQAANELVKEKLVDVQAERIRNAAMALSQAPVASTEIDMENYKFKYDQSESAINVTYRQESHTEPLEPDEFNYCTVEAPNTLTETGSALCISREEASIAECTDLDEVEVPDLPFLPSPSIGFSNVFIQGGKSFGSKLVIEPGGC